MLGSAPRLTPPLTPDRAGRGLALGLLMLTLNLLGLGCGVPEHTHRAALKDAEDARIALAKTQSRAILAEQDLKTTQAELRKAKSDLATLKREKQQLNSKLNSSPDTEIIEAVEEIVRAQDELAATLRKNLEAPIKASKLSIQIKRGYISITLEPNALFDAKDNLTGSGKTLAKLILENLQTQSAQALLMCHPSSDAKDNSRARCQRQLTALGALNTSLKTKAASLGVMERLADATPIPMLEIIILPELESLGQELESDEQTGDVIQEGILGGIGTVGS